MDFQGLLRFEENAFAPAELGTAMTLTGIRKRARQGTDIAIQRTDAIQIKIAGRIAPY